MKFFKDNCCYVSFRELARYKIPHYLVFDKDYYFDDDYIIFKDKKSMDYVRSRKDIINYCDVMLLSNEELDAKINLAEKDLDKYAKTILDTPKSQRSGLFKLDEFRENFSIYSDIYYGLINYRNNREVIDEKILEVISTKSLVKERKK